MDKKALRDSHAKRVKLTPVGTQTRATYLVIGLNFRLESVLVAGGFVAG